MKYFAALGLLALFLSACHKLPETPENTKIYFNGISPFDAQGFPLAIGDSTDWRLDDKWVTQEEMLFPAINASSCGALPDTLEFYPAFPNPCRETAFLAFHTPYGTDWYLRIVDEDFKVLATYDWKNPPPNYNTIVFKTDSFPKDTVRLYYEAIKGNCVWRGHGDILVTDH